MDRRLFLTLPLMLTACATEQSERQRVIDDIAKSYDSEAVLSITYDPENKKLKAYAAEYAHNLVYNTQLMQEIINNGNHPSATPEAKSLKKIAELVNGKVIVETQLRNETEQKMTSWLRNSAGLTIFNEADFGNNVKSRIYMSRYAFDRQILSRTDGRDTTYDVKQSLAVRVKHEFLHADAVFHGIDFGEGIGMTRNTFPLIPKPVRNFGFEYDAYSRTYEFFRDVHPHAEIAGGMFYDFMTSNFKSIISLHMNAQSLTELELDVLDRLVQKWTAYQPEIGKLLKQ